MKLFKSALLVGTCLGLLGALSAEAAIDGMDDSVRPCIEKVKLSLSNAYAQPISEADLKLCYEGAMMFDKYLTKTLPEFAAWIGVRATMEKMEDQFGKLMGMGSRQNRRVQGVLPSKYNNLPVVRAFELMRDYEENEASADERYKDKRYIIVGTVNIVKKDPVSQKVVVELQGDNLGLFNCYVYLQETQNSQAAQLNKDEVVNLEGVVHGISNELRLEVGDGKILPGNLSTRTGAL